MFRPLPITLQRGALRLEPMVEADVPDLVTLAEQNRDVLQFMSAPGRPDWYRQGLAEQREGRALPLVVRLGNQIVGTTRFMDFLPALPACEIGATWLDQSQHGSGLNATIIFTFDIECAGGTAFTKTFTGQVVISNPNSGFLAGGDSGSLMVEDVATNPRAIGLLYAGSSTTAIANPIGEVLTFIGAAVGGTATMVGN